MLRIRTLMQRDFLHIVTLIEKEREVIFTELHFALRSFQLNIHIMRLQSRTFGLFHN
jgi:hypothetical protein